MKKLILAFVACLFYFSLSAQQSVAVYWDASYSMKDRDIDRELKFLGNYFKKHQEAVVTLKVFSNDIIQQEVVEVTGGDWSSLERELRSTIYDGASSYGFLFDDQVDEFLLFTDGYAKLGKLDPPTAKPINIVSSLKDTDTNALKLIADKSGGRFFYLPKEFEPEVKEKKELFTSNQSDGFIEGEVKGADGILANVSVVNQSNNQGVASGVDGSYRIEADEGDILIFSYLGKKTVSVRVAGADIINITMADINQSLDEVVLQADVPEEEEKVNTGFYEREEKSIGYSVESISDDQVSDLDTNLKGAVSGQFTNFEVKNDVYSKTDISQFLGRGRNMSILLNQYGLVVIDGVPLAHSDSGFGGIAYSQDNIINPDMIENITYLKGLAATNKFGTIGRNGVLLITTKNAAVVKGVESKPALPQGTTATYSGNAEIISALPNEPYIDVMKTAGTVNEAFSTYLKQREIHGKSPYFYIDSHDYFKGWNNDLISDRILSNVFEIAGDDAKVLRIVAYKQQENGDFREAVNTLERIVKLEPRQSQSYRDLALGYGMAGYHQQALELYKRIDKGLNVGSADFTGLNRTILNEVKNLVSLHGNALDLIGLNDRFKRPVRYKSRIVFEWNDLDTEFDLNIVNPQNRFFTWSHTQAENSQRILQQHEEGFGLEEFYLTDGDTGEWKFNMKYYGKTSNDKSPTYIKITTIKNFGSPQQTTDIDVVRLSKQDIEQTVVRLNLN